MCKVYLGVVFEEYIYCEDFIVIGCMGTGHTQEACQGLDMQAIGVGVGLRVIEIQ